MSREGEQIYRTFIAIELPPPVRARIARHTNELRRQCPHARASWTREDNLHLTLKFLGNISGANIASVSGALENAVRGFSSFDFVVARCGAFPPHGQPKVLWIGVNDASGDLQRLYENVESQCEQIRFPPEARAFRPHLTIARVRSAKGARELAQLHQAIDFEPATVDVQELLLMRSELSSHGSRYTALTRHRFG